MWQISIKRNNKRTKSVSAFSDLSTFNDLINFLSNFPSNLIKLIQKLWEYIWGSTRIHMWEYILWEWGQVDDSATDCLLDFSCFKENYKLILRELSKQKALDADAKAM